MLMDWLIMRQVQLAARCLFSEVIMIGPIRWVRGTGAGLLGALALAGSSWGQGPLPPPDVALNRLSVRMGKAVHARADDLAAVDGVADVRDAEGRIDGDRWAKRNIELIRQALAAPPRADQGREDLTAVIFSVELNPLLLRDPYAAEVANLAEGYLPHAGASAEVIRRIIALYRKPEAERRGMGHDDIAAALDPDRPRPDQKPGQEHNPPDPSSIAKRLLRLPIDQRAAREPAMIAEMEAAARDSGNWGRLGLGYLELAGDASNGGDRGRADRYVDRLLALLREHPGFQDPARGNVDAVSPTGLAALLMETGRRDQWDAFIASQPDPLRADLAIGQVGTLALKGDFDAARAVIDRHVRPIRPDAAARLGAATRG